jgi:hypothetical protein
MMTAITCTANEPQSSQKIQLSSSSFKVDLIVQPDHLLKEFGARFDRTAIVQQVEFNGKTFLTHAGLSDEFGLHGMGLRGFDEANPQTPFIKLGVGRLLRDEPGRYEFFHHYPIEQLAPVRITARTNTSLTINQQLDDPDYGYSYHKTYRIDPNSPTLTITYNMANTGKQIMLIEQYNHNWFNFANTPINTAYNVLGGFDLICRPKPWFTQRGRLLSLNQTITKGEYTSSSCTCLPDNNWFKLSNDLTGMNVTISGDFPISMLGFFVQDDAICPEVHMTQFLARDQQWTWSRKYRFNTP